MSTGKGRWAGIDFKAAERAVEAIMPELREALASFLKANSSYTGLVLGPGLYPPDVTIEVAVKAIDGRRSSVAEIGGLICKVMSDTEREVPGNFFAPLMESLSKRGMIVRGRYPYSQSSVAYQIKSDFKCFRK